MTYLTFHLETQDKTWQGSVVKREKAIKNQTFRKTKFLAGSNIYITEDFSKRVKDKRTELQKFMRKMKKR